MKPHSKLVALAVAGMIAASPMLPPAFAGTTTSTDSTAQSVQTIDDQTQLIRTDDSVYRALQGIPAARLAIFNGAPEDAAILASDIFKGLEAAQLDAKNTGLETSNGDANGDTYVPFDMSMSLAEGFKPTPENAVSIQEANSHIANGNSKQAAEVLKLANIDVTVSAALIPIDASVNHAGDAVDLINKGQFYEANLAMKAIEDSVVVEAYSINAVPVQGS